jgi:hypothetical protein
MFHQLSAGDPGVERGSCRRRKESNPLNSRSASLFLQNYFPTYPVEADSCRENSAPLANMVNTCYKTAGNVLPNFIAVNFYMVLFALLCCQFKFNKKRKHLNLTNPFWNLMQRSNGGGVFEVVDRINGHMLCGCDTVMACQVNLYFLSKYVLL